MLNTATTNAIAHLRDHYSVPFIGMEPAIKPAALQSASGKVGVLATRGTLSSSLFHSTAKNHASHIQILEQEGTGLVELIEQGMAETPGLGGLRKGLADAKNWLRDAYGDELVPEFDELGTETLSGLGPAAPPQPGSLLDVQI